MREIIFRGKRIDNGEWVEFTPLGALFANPLNIEVELKTVGTYTGLSDKNGKRIFEGDIIKTHYANAVKADFVELVVFNNGKYCGMCDLEGGGKMYAPIADGVPHFPQDKSVYMDIVEVIGNIHDNPELLERNKNETS